MSEMTDTGTGARREFLDVAPIVHAEGSLRLPGSKSISIRMLLLAALAEGETRLSGVLDSDDTRVMRGALKACGVALEESGDSIVIRGAMPFPNREAEIFVGNSGLSARTLVAALAFMNGTYRLSGVPRMHERPIRDLVDALRPIGADIQYLANEGFLPIQINPPTAARISPLPPGEGQGVRELAEVKAEVRAGIRAPSTTPRLVRVRGDASSQFLTGLLQAGPLLAHEQELVVEVEGDLISRPYVDLTVELMKQFGVAVRQGESTAGALRFTVPAGARYVSPTGRLGTLAVEGDASSASYFLALGALAGGPVRVEGMGRNSLQGDVRFAEALAAMGATVTQGDDWTEACSPAGSSGIHPDSPSPCRLKAIDADFNHIPDAAMTLAVLALFADGPSTLRNIGSWRVKETDRIAAMAAELRKLGAEVDEGADFLRVTPPARLQPATIDTYDDHRVAMCFSLAACGGVAVRINDPGCVAKTFPAYFDALARLTQGVPSAGRQLAPGRSAGTVSPAAAAPVITIDGPTASGKGTVARRVADAVGFHLLDSGALYRLAALAAKNRGIRLNRPDELAKIARALDTEFSGGRVFLEGEDVTETIRAEWVGNAASTIAVFPELRSALVKWQHAFRRPPGLVADGRDMGTAIFPDAALKIFLTASPEARAMRRHNQLIEKGISVNIDTLLRDLHERDTRDAARSSAPLATAPDAVTIDTSDMGIEEVVSRILALANGAVPSLKDI